MDGGGAALILGVIAEDRAGSKVFVGTDVGVDPRVAGAVATKVLAGAKVGASVGETGDSIPWHAAAINATPHNNASHLDISQLYH